MKINNNNIITIIIINIMDNYINLSHQNIYNIHIGLVPYGTKILNLSFNNISYIVNLPNTIEELYIHKNNIKKILELPYNLKILYIDNPEKYKIPKHIIIKKPL